MSTPPSPGTRRPPLYRRPVGKRPGVTPGLAVHLGRSEREVGWALVFLTLIGGAGALLYLWFWIVLPVAPRATPAAPPAPTAPPAPAPAPASSPSPSTPVPDSARPLIMRWPTAAIGLILTAGAAGTALIDSAVRQLNGIPQAFLAPGLLPALFLAAATMCWSLLVDRADPTRSERYSRLVRLGTAALLVASSLGILLNGPSALTAVASVMMLGIGAILFVLPTLVILWTDLIDERSARARDGERAEIAAHLHDSVLQSLALIQRRAGSGTDVARIARAQERELREWLFGAASSSVEDLATAISEDAARIELEHPVRIDIVSSGDADGLDEQITSAVVAATREALLNAARHAGGDVSVYIERSPGTVAVFVKDRGPGINPEDIPADRLGVRESIIGRISRVGGVATVRRGRGDAPQGTEVSISVRGNRD
ncbi:MAG: ATP-binding protein [Mycetocola sp.]